MNDLEEDLEVAYLRLMTEDIGNESTIAFRNAISLEVAQHLARQLVRITTEIIKEHEPPREFDDEVDE
jgi:hypothetical protein